MMKGSAQMKQNRMNAGTESYRQFAQINSAPMLCKFFDASVKAMIAMVPLQKENATLGTSLRGRIDDEPAPNVTVAKPVVPTSLTYSASLA